VILEHYLARRSRDNYQNNSHKPQYTSRTETVLNFNSYRFYANFDSFDISDRYHVVSKDNLARQSRDNCHKP